MKRAIAILALLLLAAAPAGFAVQNPQDVEVRYYFGWLWRGPLAWALLGALVFGAVLGVAVTLPARFRERRRALKAENSVARLQREAVQSRSATRDSVPV